MTARVPSMFVLSAVLLAASAYSPNASACVEATCVNPVRLFPDPADGVPGNLVYFKILVDDPGPLTLRTALGEPIAASIRTMNADLVFAPDETIPEYTSVVLEFNSRCDGSGDVPRTFEFYTLESQSFDAAPIALQVVERGIAYDRDEEAAFVRVRAVGAAHHLKTNTITLDGAPLSVFAIPSLLTGEALTLEVRSGCLPLQDHSGTDSCGDTASVPPGVHVLQIDTTVVGAPSQPEPVVMEVETVCPSEPEALSEAPLPEAALSEAALDEPAAVDQPALLNTPIATRASSGCELAPRERSATGTAPLGAVLLALSLLLRRGSRRH